tara:strand:+ start:1569 stop:2135 length:567 start_codon:yes stop_codon:yes gene_type:complete
MYKSTRNKINNTNNLEIEPAMSVVIRRPFSESSPNVVKQTILHGSPKKSQAQKDPTKKLKQSNLGAKFKKSKTKTKKNKLHGVSPIKPLNVSKTKDKDPRRKEHRKKSYRGTSIITKAAVRRIAAKHDIAQISSECVRILADYLTKEANLCLLKARSSALHVSRRKTITLNDLASAAQSCKFGELICG